MEMETKVNRASPIAALHRRLADKSERESESTYVSRSRSGREPDAINVNVNKHLKDKIQMLGQTLIF